MPHPKKLFVSFISFAAIYSSTTRAQTHPAPLEIKPIIAALATDSDDQAIARLKALPLESIPTLFETTDNPNLHAESLRRINLALPDLLARARAQRLEK